MVAGASQPPVGAIKLAWWREALERLDRSPPPPEPRLQAVAAELLPRGVSGGELAMLEPGWSTLFDEVPVLDAVERRGALLFGLAARLLRVDEPGVEEAGRLFAMGQLARLLGRDELLSGSRHGAMRFPRALRPLTSMAVLAARDLRRGASEPEATPARALALIAHRLTGRISGL